MTAIMLALPALTTSETIWLLVIVGLMLLCIAPVLIPVMIERLGEQREKDIGHYIDTTIAQEEKDKQDAGL